MWGDRRRDRWGSLRKNPSFSGRSDEVAATAAADLSNDGVGAGERSERQQHRTSPATASVRESDRSDSSSGLVEHRARPRKGLRRGPINI